MPSRLVPLLLALLVLAGHESSHDSLHAADRGRARRSISDAPDYRAAEYYVVFCVRRSSGWGTGHAFVVWIAHDQDLGQASCESFGFYPGADRVVSKFFLGTGRVVDELAHAASSNPALLTHQLIVPVDAIAFATSLEVKNQWDRGEAEYNLFSRNCTHFAYDVSRAIGREGPKPALGERPPHYLERLAEALRAEDVRD